MEFEEWRQIAERLIQHLFESHEETRSELRVFTKSEVFMSDRIDQLTDAMTKMAEAVTHVAETVDQVAEAGRRADERTAEMAVKMSETTEKLDALIAIVEQHLRDHGNGKHS
jgi:methyl-accepting chemotaxis protein